MFLPTRRSPIALPVVALLILTACGSDGGPTPLDTRCGGLAQVPAWRIVFHSALHTVVAVDTIDVRLNDSIATTDTTGPGALPPGDPDPDHRAWLGGTPSGTMSAHDTVIITSSHDTISGDASEFAASVLTSIPGLFLSADLTNCHLSFGAQLSASMVLRDTSATVDTLTTFIAYVRAPSVTFDPTIAANGFELTSRKVYSPSNALASFSADPEYRVGSLTALLPSTTVFDSATVSWSVTPLAAAPVAHPAGAGVASGRGTLPPVPRMTP